MKNVKQYIILIIFLIFTTNIFAQWNYQTGYIVTNQNDTIYGFVKDRKPEPFGKLYKKVRFKKELKTIFPKYYSPHQISAYKQGYREYQSMWVAVEGFIFNENYKCIENYGQKVFMRVIINGKLTYYQWEFKDGDSGYIDAIDLFKKENEQVYAKATQGILGLKKKKLAIYFSDYPELANKILNKEIKSPAEVAIFYNQKYN